MNLCVCNAKCSRCTIPDYDSPINFADECVKCVKCGSMKHDSKCYYKIIAQFVGIPTPMQAVKQSQYKYKYYIEKKLRRFGLTYDQERYVLDVYARVRREFAMLESKRRRIMKVDFIFKKIFTRMGLPDKAELYTPIKANLDKYNKIWSEIEDNLKLDVKWSEIEDELNLKIIWSKIDLSK